MREDIAQCLAIICQYNCDSYDYPVPDTYWARPSVFPTTLATLLTYRQVIALQRPIDVVTQGTFYCWVDVLLAELVSSVLYNPVSTSGTNPACPSLERLLHDERISLASCLPCESCQLYPLSPFGRNCFPANWESLLALLGHPHSSPGLRRFVISILYLQLCLVPDSASYES